MWVRFLRDFDWSPSEAHGRVTVRFKAGDIHFVRRACAAAALEAGAAEEVERPGP